MAVLEPGQERRPDAPRLGLRANAAELAPLVGGSAGQPPGRRVGASARRLARLAGQGV